MRLTPFGIEAGPVVITFFGLIAIGAVIAGAAISAARVRRSGQETDTLLDALTWGLVGGVLAGRLFYVWNPPPSVAAVYDRRWYLTHFFDLQFGPLAVWSGGLGAGGILLGALAGAAIALRRRGVSLREWADLLTPGLLVTLAILPWANIANQQMFGPPTDLPWGMALARRVPPFDDLAAFAPTTRFHPTPAYVSLWALVTLGIVWLVDRRFGGGMRAGDRLLLAGAVYLPGVFLADFLRLDVSRPVFGLTGLQGAAGALFAAVVALGIWRWRAAGGEEADRTEGPPASGG